MWKLDGHQAVLSNGDLTLEVDIRYPAAGLKGIQYKGQSLASLKPLQISAEPKAPEGGESIHDAYVRGSDLIVTYEQTESRSVRPQMYWRALVDKENQAVGIEMILAVQTSLLESNPTLSSVTELAAATAWHCNADDVSETAWDEIKDGSSVPASCAGAFLFHPQDEDALSYVEMIYPEDFLGAKCDGGDVTRVEYQLFPESLEKGVIRKGRIQSWFLPREADQTAARKLYDQLETAAPPLTT